MRRWLPFILTLLAACGVSEATGDPPEGRKVWVCKYVSKPGEDERLQTGQNPISVSVNAIPLDPPIEPGDEFADAQGRSVVIAFDDGGPEPPVEDCPAPTPPTTTTSSTTTTTTSSTSSTTTTTTPTTTSSSTTLPPSTSSTTVPSSSTSTTVPATTTAPPTLSVDFLTPICDGDVPYLTYSASFGSATRVTRITFVNPTGPDVTYSDLPLAGRVLWPGAVVAADGSPLDWPGWTEVAPDVWVEGDEFDWVRPSVTVELEINPVTSAVVGYPPSTPQCATNPPPNAPPPGAPPVTTTPPPGLPPTK